MPATSFTAAHLAVIKRATEGFGFIDEPYWPAAAQGDPAAAIGVALRALKRHRKVNPCVDLVMSTLLRCAIEGSTTAALVIGYVLGCIATADPACTSLAASWHAQSSRREWRSASKGG